MPIPRWSPPLELSTEEKFVVSRLKRTGKLYVFLREHRSELFDDEFQAELESMYENAPYGMIPLPPALLAMVTLLQAYQQSSDAVAVENAMLDRRWQMVLDGMNTERPLFSQGALVDFRRRLIESDMDRRLIERTVELAKATRGFGHTALRVALDSAPLWGAGRVEDTFNLIGHAMNIVVDCAAVVAGMDAEEVKRQAGTKTLGGLSIKSSLDIDWDDKTEQKQALMRLMEDVRLLQNWVSASIPDSVDSPPLGEALALLKQVVEQDIEPDPDGGGSRIREGTAKNRRISLSDSDMRHGRKSKSRVINGYKRHIATDLDDGLILAALVRPANEREHGAETEIKMDVERLGHVVELHINRGYLAGTWPQELHDAGLLVLSKPWSGNKERLSKADFQFDFENNTATCPSGILTSIRRTTEIQPQRASFRASDCRACDRRAECLPESAKGGRTLTLHKVEPLLQTLRQLRRTPEGRQKLRERVAVEHSLAHVCARQGRRARYLGVRKNTFDTRRVAAIENLHCLQRKAA